MYKRTNILPLPSLLCLLLAMFGTTAAVGQIPVGQKGDSLQQQVPGHYLYRHSWSYAVGADSIYCFEEGTMDFFAKGSALDHALQHYLLVRQDGSRVAWDFDYYSPSYWRLDGDDFFFSGDSATFKMECLSKPEKEDDASWYYNYAQETAANVHRYINHETKFHLSELTEHRLVWSYTYPDGHTDTWLFER